jgi:hypothetical protein
MAAGSGATSKVRTKPPIEFTSATPGTSRSAGRRVQSTRWRRAIGSSPPPSTVNTSISERGVTTGAKPPEAPSGNWSWTSRSRSLTCTRAQ